jgi:hypothetical protein
MKTARFLLACVAASLLAACSADSITAPATPNRPSFDEGVGPGDSGEGIDGTGDGTGCIPILVVNSDGSISSQCLVYANGQLGTGN